MHPGPPDTPDPHRFAFVGGLQRSGTTLVGRLLGALPDVTGLVNTPTREDEGQFVQSVYLDDHVMGRRGRRPAGQGIRWAFHPEAHLVERDAAEREGAARRLRASWSPFWEDPSASVRVEKSPSNVTRTRFLQALYPDSSFVVVTRHPVVQALAMLKWADSRTRVGFDVERIVEHWLTAMEAFAADRTALTRVTTVSYEHLIRSPRETVTGLADFLGVDPGEPDTSSVVAGDDRYAAFWEGVTRRAPRASYPALEGNRRRLVGPVFRVVEPRTAALLGPLRARHLERRFGHRVAEFGYDVARLGGPVDGPRPSAAGHGSG